MSSSRSREKPPEGRCRHGWRRRRAAARGCRRAVAAVVTAAAVAVATKVVAAARSATAITATAEHGQVAVEALQHDFRRVAVGAALILPLSGLQLALDINGRALLQILFGDLAEAFVEDHDRVPFGLFLALAAVLVAPCFRGRNAQVGDRPAVLGPAISGSAPRLPIRMTLLTLPAMTLTLLPRRRGVQNPIKCHLIPSASASGKPGGAIHSEKCSLFVLVFLYDAVNRIEFPHRSPLVPRLGGSVAYIRTVLPGQSPSLCRSEPDMSELKTISIRGAREHNLKGIDLDLPRNSLIVMTGLSGSGKSSLAFDTIYAEGQRRYVESLSAYARQFLEMMQKPDVDQIEGLSPAISIEQKTTSRNPRSTVGTVTEIYDYMRLVRAGRRALFAGNGPADREPDGKPDGRPDPGAGGRHAPLYPRADDPRAKGRVQERTR